MRIAIGGWQAAGHAVLCRVPAPEDPKDAGLKTGTVAGAARDVDVVVLATPWEATQDALRAPGDLSSRIVIDSTNQLNYSPEAGLSVPLGFGTSGGEQVAGWAPGASVFKTLNQTGAEGMAEARAFAQAPVMFVAGDDEDRKPVVLGLVADLGFEALDAGPLAQARLLEPFAMLWIDHALKRGRGRASAFAITRKAGLPRPPIQPPSIDAKPRSPR